MATMPKTIGVFAGLLTREGKLRLQRRIEKDSLIPGKTYEGDWELSGGRVEEKNIKKALTLEVLQAELIREVKEELGILIKFRPRPSIYRTIYEDPEKGICDWALMIPIPGPYWDEIQDMKRTTIDVDPSGLRELANQPKGNQLVSGWGKRMCRMGEGAFLLSYVERFVRQAKDALTEMRPNWRKAEFFENAEEALSQFRRELGSE